jgi:hypothetical protein
MKTKYKNHIYNIPVSCDFDSATKKFTDNLEEDEEIIATEYLDTCRILMITTRRPITDSNSKPTNLLLEETQKRIKKQ